MFPCASPFNTLILTPRRPLPLTSHYLSGIYSIVRHPIYAGILLLALGLAVATSELERLLLTGLLFLALVRTHPKQQASSKPELR